MRKLDENGHEVPDPTPLSIPSNFKRPETLAEQVQRLVRTSISMQAAQQGFETFDEAEDFDVGEADPSTPYETFFDPVLGKELTPAEFRQYENIYRERYLKAQDDYFKAMDRQEVLKRRLRPESGGEGGSPPSDASEAPTPPKSRKRAKEADAE